MNLLPDDELERSAVVANCRMNRERGLPAPTATTGNSASTRIDFLKDRLVPGKSVAWLDLCCGTGKALIEAATLIRRRGPGRRDRRRGSRSACSTAPTPA